MASTKKLVLDTENRIGTTESGEKLDIFLISFIFIIKSLL